jgi:hypothetical protein
MRLIEVLKNNNIVVDKDLEDIFEKVALDIYSDMSYAWPKESLINNILYVDLNEDDIKKIIIQAARYSKVWAFS